MLCGISGYVATQWNVVTLWTMLNGCCAEVAVSLVVEFDAH